MTMLTRYRKDYNPAMKMFEDPDGEYVKLAAVQALFTRADVTWLREIVREIRWLHLPEDADRCERLAAKIAALLPPA